LRYSQYRPRNGPKVLLAKDDQVIQAILGEMARCVEMVIRVSDLALEHREAGRSLSDFAVPIDVATIDAEDADILLQALVLSPAAGAA
jgi:hypothetical protein